MIWLANYTELSWLHLLCCKILNGGPSRGTELTAMVYQNTTTRSVCNRAWLISHRVMRRTYSKTQTMAGKDWLIPHALDGYLSALIQDLALAQPFAELALQICFPQKTATLHLYQYYLFVNGHSLFKTEHLSSIMKEYTVAHLSTALTVRDWRHIAIAWCCILCPTDQDLMDDNLGDDYIGAEQTGHTVDTERMKYAVSPEALAGNKPMDIQEQEQEKHLLQ